MRNLILLAVFILTCASMVQARDVWLSSNTATVDSAKTLCGGGKRGILHGLCVNTTAGSSITNIYNSSFTIVSSTIAGRANGVQGCTYYDVIAPKGLLYDKTGLADVTFLYDCF